MVRGMKRTKRMEEQTKRILKNEKERREVGREGKKDNSTEKGNRKKDRNK